MFKKLSILVAAGVLSVSLVACSNNQNKQSGTGSDNTKTEQSKDKASKKGTVYEIQGATTEDNGIVQTIQEVSVFDNMKDAVKSYGQSDLVVSEENKDKVTVVVKFEIVNKNDFMINTYPSQATFVTNTGEQVDADMWASDSFDGEIHGGVTKDGHVLFNLAKTSIDELKIFKMIWSTNSESGTSDNYGDDYYKDNELEVTLTK